MKLLPHKKPVHACIYDFIQWVRWGGFSVKGPASKEDAVSFQKRVGQSSIAFGVDKNFRVKVILLTGLLRKLVDITFHITFIPQGHLTF